MKARSCKCLADLLGIGLCLLAGLGQAQSPAAAGPGSSSGRTPLLHPSVSIVEEPEAGPYPLNQLTPAMSYPFVDRGYLVQFRIESHNGASPNIFLYDSNAKVYQGIVWLERARKVTIVAASVSADGGVIAAGTATNQDGSLRRYLVKLDKNGKVARVLDTRDYLATDICAADSENIWTTGYSTLEIQDPSSTILRDWNFDKGLQHGLLHRSEFQAPFLSGAARVESILRCNAHTIGVYVSRLQWIEVNRQRLDIKRWNIVYPDDDVLEVYPEDAARWVTGLVLSDGGHIYASFVQKVVSPPAESTLERPRDRQPILRRRGVEELTFDSEAGVAAWVPIEDTVSNGWHEGKLNRLVGIFNDKLVYSQLRTYPEFALSLFQVRDAPTVPESTVP